MATNATEANRDTRSAVGDARVTRAKIPIVLGVVGHREYRPNDEQKLRKSLKDIFRKFQLAFAHTPLVLLSALAEGTDQLAAKVADELNTLESIDIELRVPLPFPAAVYSESSSFGCVPGEAQSSSGKQAAAYMLDRVARAGNDAFVVPLDDAPIDDIENWTRLRDDRDSRHRCYSNAASYIARHCNTLIALWDGAEARGGGGTAEHVKFKLDGNRPPSYPPGPALGSQGDTGPVYVIHTPRPGSTAPDGGEITVRVPNGHTLRSPPSLIGPNRAIEVAGNADVDLALIREEWSQFLATCQAIDQFNADASKFEGEDTERRDDMQKALEALPLHARAKDELMHLAKIRIRASKISITLEPRRTLALIGLFGVMFLSALFFHLYAHLTYKYAHLTYADDLHTPAYMAASLASLLLAAAIVNAVMRTRLEARRLDARALAEALRVRCWWGIAGISVSAADSYLNQLRGEMAWARRALYTLSPPPRMWKHWFETLSINDQHAVLRHVEQHWIKKQAAFFHGGRHKNEKRARRLKRAGLTLAVCGWFVGLCLILPWPPGERHVSSELATRPSESSDPHDLWTAARQPNELLLIASGVFLLLGGLTLAYRERQAYEELANQYDRMAVVFNHGCKELKKALDVNNPHPLAVAQSQEILIHLGREAITEHAQWLVLRRSRPLEPPLS